MQNRIQQHSVTGIPHSKSSHQLFRQYLRTDLSTFNNWFRRRKRGAQHLRNLSGGKIELAEGGYRGHSADHWLTHLDCGCLFRASVQDVYRLGADAICPFCNLPPEHLRRYGRVAVLRELVWHSSYGNVDFSDTNHLGRADGEYEFVCTNQESKLVLEINSRDADVRVAQMKPAKGQQLDVDTGRTMLPVGG